MFFTPLSSFLLSFSFSQGGRNIASRFTFRAYFRKTVPYFVFRLRDSRTDSAILLVVYPLPLFHLIFIHWMPTPCANIFRIMVSLPDRSAHLIRGWIVWTGCMRRLHSRERSVLIVRGNNNKENKVCPVIKPRRLPSYPFLMTTCRSYSLINTRSDCQYALSSEIRIVI